MLTSTSSSYGKIPCRYSDNTEPEPEEGNVNYEYNLLCDLYLFAEKVRDANVMDAVIVALLARYNEEPQEGRYIPVEDTVNNVYVKTEPGSPLRESVVDMHLWLGHEDALLFEPIKLDQEFLFDLARTLVEKHRTNATGMGAPTPAGVSICDQHKPGDCDACAGRKRERKRTK